MSDVGDAMDEVRSELDGSASEFMADVCDVILLTPGQDDSGGSGNTASTVVADVPCSYEALKQPFDKQIGGRVLIGLTHKITLPSNSNTQAILPKHKIVVDARGNTPSLTFNDPVVLSGSLAPFVTVAASLAEQA